MAYQLLRIVPAALACLALLGQSQDLTFEAASIKPATPLPQPNSVQPFRGGPGTTDPGTFTCTDCALLTLVGQAYGPLLPGEFQGPDWLVDAHFDIAAKLPPGATVEQFRIMLRNLLVERFKIAVHREVRPTSVLELTVTRDGPKFKAADPQNQLYEATRVPIERDAEGFPILPPGVEYAAGGGRGRIHIAGKPVGELTNILSPQCRMPVLDKTGLTGTDDIQVSFRFEMEGQGAEARCAGMTDAIQSQLGLRLQQKKGQAEVVIVDHIEKVPSAN
jgi:uncharacterized protein (TIGR03435 family)